MWIMAKRSRRHTTRSLDTIITVVLTPIAMLLLFVYVFGGALGEQTGTIEYVDFITPGVIIMTVGSIAYAAVRLSMDLQKGIISRFRTMPVAPSSVLSGQALSSTLKPLLLSSFWGRRSSLGFARLRNGRVAVVRRHSGVVHARHDMDGHVLRPAGQNGGRRRGLRAYILLLLIFISPSFVPTDSMTPLLRGFCRTPADDSDHRDDALTIDRWHTGQ